MIDIRRERREMTEQLGESRWQGDDRNIGLCLERLDLLDFIEATSLTLPGPTSWVLEMTEGRSTSMVRLRARTKAGAVTEAGRVVAKHPHARCVRLYECRVNKLIKK